MDFRKEILLSRQQKILRIIGPIATSRRFYLAGGTAVALHLGHRRSVDFDWFIEEKFFDPVRLGRDIKDIGFEMDEVEAGTLHGEVGRVRVSFIEFRYPLLKPLAHWPEMGCDIASLEDLSSMKLSAVAQRGTKKDFLDIFAIVSSGISLQTMLTLYQKKFQVRDIAHVLYGLAYFDDADRERMPKTLWKMDWNAVKRNLLSSLKRLKS